MSLEESRSLPSLLDPNASRCIIIGTAGKTVNNVDRPIDRPSATAASLSDSRDCRRARRGSCVASCESSAFLAGSKGGVRADNRISLERDRNAERESPHVAVRRCRDSVSASQSASQPAGLAGGPAGEQASRDSFSLLLLAHTNSSRQSFPLSSTIPIPVNVTNNCDWRRSGVVCRSESNAA